MAVQPYPPRQVSFSDLWQIHWPLLVWIPTPVLLFDIVVVAGHLETGPALLLINGFALATLAMWVSVQLLPQARALRLGVLKTGTITAVARTPRGAYNGRLRFDDGSEMPFVLQTDQKTTAGDRLDVLVNPENSKVMATIAHHGGAAPT